jgi:hypothetical protein
MEIEAKLFVPILYSIEAAVREGRKLITLPPVWLRIVEMVKNAMAHGFDRMRPFMFHEMRRQRDSATNYGYEPRIEVAQPPSTKSCCGDT